MALTRSERWVVIVALLLGCGLGGLFAQQQTSGGQAVTVTSGTITLGAGAASIGSLAANQSVNTAQINGVAPTMGNGASGTGVQRMTLANDSTGQVALAAGSTVGLATGANTIGAISNSTFGLVAGTAKIGITYPWTPCGTTSWETGSPAGVAAMPTVSTSVAAATTCVLTIIVSNTSAGNLTYTMSDAAGTPINFLNAVTILPGERDEYTFPNGMKFNAGVKVAASGSGITYYASGLQ